MPGVMVALVIGLMGLAWFTQGSGKGQRHLWRELNSKTVSSDTARSQVVVVDSVNVPPVVCKPIETDENKPAVRNLTQSFEERQYVLEPGEKCSPDSGG